MIRRLILGLLALCLAQPALAIPRAGYVPGVRFGLRYFGTATPFDYSQIPSIDAVFLASQGITQSGGNVSAWASGVGTSTATQATGANQPAYSATGFNGNKPAVTFGPGTSQILQTSYNTQVPVTLFALYYQPSGVVVPIGSASGGLTFYTDPSAHTLTMDKTGVVNILGVTDATNIVSNVPLLIVITYDGSAWTARVNGNATGSGTNAQTISSVASYLNDGNFRAVTAIAVSGRATTVLTLSDQQKIEGKMACDNGVQSILPAGHPYKSSCP